MSFKLGEIADVIRADVIGDPDREITGVATLKSAGADQLSFFANRRYSRYLKTTRAAAVVLGHEDAEQCPVSALVSSEPYLAFVKAVRYLNPEPDINPGLHPSAIICSSAKVGSGASIGANAWIGDNVVIGDNTLIGPGCVIDNGVVIGKDTRLIANVTLCHDVHIGERVILHPGVVIGSDGFGIANDDGKWLKIPQLGSVVIHDDVEIGANTTIDRGALENTIIEEGVKIDNQVQIGHNVIIGAHTAIAGSAGMAGSVIVGKHCMIGGAVAITGHIEIADNVTITGLSGVTNSIKTAGVYSGSLTTTDNRTWRKNMVRLRHLDQLARRVAVLEEKSGK
ncbi:MAG: UDP-3-O-(3-hydroxymyristoyl)glucosamine N-acyltransferase [Gammaproteobacteria bacterium]